MSDSTRRAFEAWLATQMHRQPSVDAEGPARVMARIRSLSVHAPRRRHEKTPATAFAFAACVVGLFAFRIAAMLTPVNQGSAYGDAGLRDTISAFQDSMTSAARLVGVAVIAPAAARIAVAHDFHGWDLRIDPAAVVSDVDRRTAVSIAPGLHLSPVGDRTRGADSVPDRR